MKIIIVLSKFHWNFVPKDHIGLGNAFVPIAE